MSITGATQYITNINPIFPTPGINNNSQGFRDNFNNSREALSNLDTYMNTLAATTDNVNNLFVTGTQLISAMETLQLGSTNFISIGQLKDIVITGRNPDGTIAAGSIAFLPNVVPMAVESVSNATGSFNTYNTTSGILVGATFTCNNPVPSGPYTVTGVSGNTVYTSPSPTFDDRVVNISNPNFTAFTVINAATVTSIVSEAFANDVTLVANDDSTNYTNGTLVVQGGVGVSGTVNVHGNTNIGGNLNVKGSIVSTSSNVTLQGLTIAGDLTINDTNNDFIPNVTVNLAAWKNNLVSNNGYQVFPSGLIMMWGTTENVLGDHDVTVVFPTIEGNNSGGFTHSVLSVTTTVWNNDNNGYEDLFAQIVSVSNTEIKIKNNISYHSGPGTQPVNWFAIGF